MGIKNMYVIKSSQQLPETTPELILVEGFNSMASPKPCLYSIFKTVDFCLIYFAPSDFKQSIMEGSSSITLYVISFLSVSSLKHIV